MKKREQMFGNPEQQKDFNKFLKSTLLYSICPVPEFPTIYKVKSDKK